jgi:hypothetical protein
VIPFRFTEIDGGSINVVYEGFAYHSSHDEVEVQWEAVDWLERLGTSDMIPALTELAQPFPGQGATEDDVAVRKNAAKATATIRRRAGQQ